MIKSNKKIKGPRVGDKAPVEINMNGKTEFEIVDNCRTIRIRTNVYDIDTEETVLNVHIQKDFDELPNPVKNVLKNLYTKLNEFALSEAAAEMGVNESDFKIVEHDKLDKDSKDEKEDKAPKGPK